MHASIHEYICTNLTKPFAILTNIYPITTQLIASHRIQQIIIHRLLRSLAHPRHQMSCRHISFWNFGLWNAFSTSTTTVPAPTGLNSAAPPLVKIDFSSPSCLDLLTVRPVSVLVRRLPACTMSYQTVGDIQEKYRSRFASPIR